MAEADIMREAGPLDLLIARLRYRQARRHIGTGPHPGRILDLGCGCHPLFLTTVDFAEKYGLDKEAVPQGAEPLRREGVTVRHHDLAAPQPLPFARDFFDVVTMLAVVEHLEPARVVPLHRDIHRVLKPGGRYILTTPAPRADAVLQALGRLHLISGTIREHQSCYTPAGVVSLLETAGFAREKIRVGYFECYLNVWATALK